ncbi:MAG: HD-GYP domain-containing protein [Gammaproteobacteria bacterium]|nr:HD-GYP domain-containing protein [Rhodocyclaceae bacterium]MBU3909817.1 HD-GYP domain-containing protein [Gammaproteobacteria bacterium]MBU3988081.1 HD-GYP domain-containing protein [Gammaproteobacteria bacterium]MBU4003604.1 HD-GYP domain-containing protein [Gammaproteobacteria bacterium]MBU4020037.1 HD-GYP domain-containing protein [Gammaproteobacteria bacterium]
MNAEALHHSTGERRPEIPVSALAEDDRQIARKLKQRDRNALLGYGLSVFVVVVIMEMAVFHFHMAERFGIAPVLARGVIYLLLTTALWAALLRTNRRLVSKMMSDKQASYESVLLAYDKALGLKDAYSGGHGRRVALYAHGLASAMGLSHAEANTIREAALLHDIGKIGIPDAILTKPGELTVAELHTIRQHPAMGAGIIQAIPLLSHLAPAVRHHHEHFDGGGYPVGLQGHAIPLAARVIAVADALDALGSDRSYRKSMPLDAAVTEIVKASGKQFDPEIVGVLADKFILTAMKNTSIDNPSTRNDGRQ